MHTSVVYVYFLANLHPAPWLLDCKWKYNMCSHVAAQCNHSSGNKFDFLSMIARNVCEPFSTFFRMHLACRVLWSKIQVHHSFSIFPCECRIAGIRRMYSFLVARWRCLSSCLNIFIGWMRCNKVEVEANIDIVSSVDYNVNSQHIFAEIIFSQVD